MQVASPARKIQVEAVRRIYKVLRDPKGVPNGKSSRTTLKLSDVRALRSALIVAVGHASVWASHGPLLNRIRTRGRPPDNAVSIFIDDIVRACEAAGLKPGLRYVSGSESLPVRLYQELAPLLWGGTASATPRRVFERWQRYRLSLMRS
jgi:hypothetical protein